MNREEWLTTVASDLIPDVERITGKTLGPFAVTLGFPSKRATSGKHRRIGECVYAHNVSDGRAFLSISPMLSDEVEIAATVAHELGHVALGPEVGHKAEFARFAREIGLDGKPTATSAGEAFKQRIAPLLERLGPFPHGAVSLTNVPKQSTRLLKVTCAHDPGYIVRMSRKALDEYGAPYCPCHTDEMREA